MEVNALSLAVAGMICSCVLNSCRLLAKSCVFEPGSPLFETFLTLRIDPPSVLLTVITSGCLRPYLILMEDFFRASYSLKFLEKLGLRDSAVESRGCSETVLCVGRCFPLSERNVKLSILPLLNWSNSFSILFLIALGT